MSAQPSRAGRPPASDVSPAVGLVGLAALFAWIVLCRNWRSVTDALALPGPRERLAGPYAALTAMVLAGSAMAAWSLLVEKVHRRPSTGIAWDRARPLAASLHVSGTKLAGLWATWAYTAPVVGEPARLVPYSAVQAGITSKVYRTAGVGAPPFGVRRGGASTVTKLANEWSDADRHDLYVAGINVAVDDGTTIAPWGFCTLDPQRINQDLHQAFVRMVLKWSAEQLAKAYLGEPVDANTLASYNGRLQLLGKEFVAARAMAAVTVDTDSPNTPVTMAARELHAVMSIQQTPTSDWVDLVIPVAPYTG